MLNDAKIKAAKPRDKAYKLTDAEQLYLFISPTGSKLWRMNYQFGVNATGKPVQKTLSLGAYPTLSLADARARRDEIKAILRAGKDPSVERRLDKRANATAHQNTFQAVAHQWFELSSG